MVYRYVFRGNNEAIPLSSLVFAISELMDRGYGNPLSLHQLRTSYICRLIARELGMEGRDFEDVVVTAALHDIGLVKFLDKKKVLQDDENVIYQHSIVGCNMLKRFPYTKRIADIIYYHHTPWDVVKGETDWNLAVSSNIVHFADRLEVAARSYISVVLNASEIKKALGERRGDFSPDVIDAFLKVSEKDLFWLRLEYFKKETEVFFDSQYITMIPREKLIDLAMILSLLIDAKSPFTKVHSQGVAAISRWLGSFFGMKGMELNHLEVAGYLHDLGKLAVPENILDKPGKLTPEEWSVMKSHVFFTYRALEQIPNIHPVHLWAAHHHERINGKGYPAGLSRDGLSLGSRIVAVADVTTALLEKRPYRKEIPLEKAADIIKDMAGSSLDERIVGVVIHNMDYARGLIRDAMETRKEDFERIGISA